VKATELANPDEPKIEEENKQEKGDEP